MLLFFAKFSGFSEGSKYSVNERLVNQDGFGVILKLWKLLSLNFGKIGQRFHVVDDALLKLIVNFGDDFSNESCNVSLNGFI